MKINNNIIKSIGLENTIANSKKPSAIKQEAANLHNFDKLIIDKSQSKTQSNTDFRTNISAKISAEVKSNADTPKIQKLQADVANGDYQVNSAEIVRKLMIGLL